MFQSNTTMKSNQRKGLNDKKKNKNREKFMKFVPFGVKQSINKLSEKEQEEIKKFLEKLINKSSVYCEHCNTLIKCCGPCDLNTIRGYCCGPLCYKCYKGDNWNSPCPSVATKNEKDKYLKTHCKYTYIMCKEIQ